jgi:hypothetical protein
MILLYSIAKHGILKVFRKIYENLSFGALQHLQDVPVLDCHSTCLLAASNEDSFNVAGIRTSLAASAAAALLKHRQARSFVKVTMALVLPWRQSSWM